MYQDLKRFKYSKSHRGKSLIYVQFWRIIQVSVFRHSPQFMYGWRRFLLRSFGANIGQNVKIRPTVKIFCPWNLKIGNWSWIGEDVTLLSSSKIDIGSNAVISQNSYLAASGHNYSISTFDILTEQDIIIENEVWIQSNVFIAPNVTIGYGTVIGYSSTVNKDMPPKMICFGNPAKVIKPR